MGRHKDRMIFNIWMWAILVACFVMERVNHVSWGAASRAASAGFLVSFVFLIFPSSSCMGFCSHQEVYA